MLTKNLIANIAEKTGMTKKRTEEMLSAGIAVLSENLMAGKVVQLQGLGQLEIREKKAREIVHPRTGEKQLIPAKRQLCFKPSTLGKEALR